MTESHSDLQAIPLGRLRFEEAWRRLQLITVVIISLFMFTTAWCYAEGGSDNGSTAVRLGIQLGHGDEVKTAVFSPDYKVVLTASKDRTARLWEIVTGRELRRFEGHGHGVNSATFAAAGGTVLTASNDRTARLWEAATGRELRRIEGHSDKVNSAVFSPDSRFVLTASSDKTARLWEASTGRELRRIEGHSDEVNSAVFSPDSRFVLTASSDKTARLWEASTGRELRRIEGHSDKVNSAVFSPDGRLVLTASADKTVRLWETATGREQQCFTGHGGAVISADFAKDGLAVLSASDDGTAAQWDTGTGRELRRFKEHGDWVNSAVFSNDGRTVLTASDDKTARLWAADTGRQLRCFGGPNGSVRSAIFSTDGRTVLTASEDKTARLWDLAAGREVRRFEGHREGVYFAIFSPDGQRILTASEDKTARLWDLGRGRQLQRFEGHVDRVNSAMFLPDGNKVLTASLDSTARLWEAATGYELRRFYGHALGVSFAVPSADGRHILTAGYDKTARLWETNTGRELRRFEGHEFGVSSAFFSPDEKMVLTASWDNTVRLWKTATARELRRLEGHLRQFEGLNDPVFALFSSDGRLILTASGDRTARLWETDTGRELRRFEGHDGKLYAAAFAPDKRTIVTASQDKTTRIWNTETGEELARLISFRDDTWVVATLDGRFDTNNLEEIKGLHWIVSDDPMHALPLEIFMRDYYEPRLLPRVLAGEKFAKLPRLDQLNRAQPKAEIKDIHVQDTQAGLVTVMVEVTNGTLELQRDGKVETMYSGAYDLRLFRDGQLVAQVPEASEAASSGEQTREQELASWRRVHEIVETDPKTGKKMVEIDPKTGKKTVTFSGIHLPRKAGGKEVVEFSAYAFNSDRVKSETMRKKFSLPKELLPRQARAYILTIGVNRFRGDAMKRLSFAANDARGLSTELGGRLKAVKDPETGKLLFGDTHVIPITLTTELVTGPKKKEFINHATKDRIKAVIEKLAGKSVDPARLAGIPNADQLQRSTPDDLVFIAFSTHGDTDGQGQFYLMPYDLGTSKVEADIRRNAISSEELSAWLRTLDADELVMIVDACHSAATVQSKEFKPGPMGSRGLGQLAFDKGMRILAASQSDQAALETDKTKQGLLSYALVREGLKDNAADTNDDKRILLSEWLNYGAERVPGLYQDYRDGKLKARAARPLDAPVGKHLISIQQPALFDFAKGRDTFISEQSTAKVFVP